MTRLQADVLVSIVKRLDRLEADLLDLRVELQQWLDSQQGDADDH